MIYLPFNQIVAEVVKTMEIQMDVQIIVQMDAIGHVLVVKTIVQMIMGIMEWGITIMR